MTELSAAEQQRRFMANANEPDTPTISDQDAARLKKIDKAAKAGFVSKWSGATPGTNIAGLDFPYQPVTTDKDPIGGPIATLQDAEALLAWYAENGTGSHAPQAIRNMQAGVKLRWARLRVRKVNTDNEAAEAEAAAKAERRIAKAAATRAALEDRMAVVAAERAARAASKRARDDAKAEAERAAWAASKESEFQGIMQTVQALGQFLATIPNEMTQETYAALGQIKSKTTAVNSALGNHLQGVCCSRHFVTLPTTKNVAGKTLKRK